MNNRSYEDFLKLMQEAIDSYHEDDDLDDAIEMEQTMDYGPPEPPKFKANNIGTTDMTNVKKDKMHDLLFKCSNIKVGKFTLQITSYHGVPSVDGSIITMNLRILEHATRTPNGMPCSMDYDINIHKDMRFRDKPWLRYFKGGSYAADVPSETVVDIIRWLQAIIKLSAFF